MARIVVMNPHNGKVKALVGGYSFEQVSLTEQRKQKDSQVQLLSLLYMLLL